ncbi:MAG: hypothetical protein OEY01_14335 [Desulfobulbaceae bacterium]|nr:hypothetical protein [Desulfobulbaceae bacterium]
MMKTKKKEAKPVATAANTPLVYVGPNMGGELTLRQYTVYRNGLPAHLAGAVESDTEMQKLFVPVADLQSARAELNKKGSRLHRAHGETLRKYLAARRAK